MSTPPQRLVLNIPPSRQITTRDFTLFMEGLKQHGVVDGEDVTVSIERDGSLKFCVPVPPKEMPKKTKREQAVEKQLASRREAIENGEEVPGYVPPVQPKRVVRIPKQKARRKVTIKKASPKRASTDGRSDG